MSKDYSKFKEKYLDSFDVDNVTGEQMIERTNCLDCEEYDNEKHYCPKFCSVIRNTMDEIIRDRIPVEWIRKYTEENRLYQSDDFDLYISDMIADWAERKEE